MKYLGSLLVLFLLATSCSLDDDGTNYHYEILPVESVDLPDSFEYGGVYEITLTYNRPSTCHRFNEFYFRSDGNERIVAVINSVLEENNCTELTDDLVEVSFDFRVIYTGTYVFKFWQGKDENDNDLYYIVEVPVVE
ncbi:hypothetical protein [Aegicerativicinus sediminis]|uniref:hypothetical protein n=1 Tax=Aegicerativicinus sediminis TaxID=2893202 RepID=UPI001E501484|nr:hypothetical protein [Aegicerativicinus sediminis]